MKILIFYIIKDNPQVQFKSCETPKLAHFKASLLAVKEEVLSIVIHYSDDKIEVIK